MSIINIGEVFAFHSDCNDGFMAAMCAAYAAKAQDTRCSFVGVNYTDDLNEALRQVEDDLTFLDYCPTPAQWEQIKKWASACDILTKHINVLDHHADAFKNTKGFPLKEGVFLKETQGSAVMQRTFALPEEGVVVSLFLADEHRQERTVFPMPYPGQQEGSPARYWSGATLTWHYFLSGNKWGELGLLEQREEVATDLACQVLRWFAEVSADHDVWAKHWPARLRKLVHLQVKAYRNDIGCPVKAAETLLADYGVSVESPRMFVDIQTKLEQRFGTMIDEEEAEIERLAQTASFAPGFHEGKAVAFTALHNSSLFSLVAEVLYNRFELAYVLNMTHRSDLKVGIGARSKQDEGIAVNDLLREKFGGGGHKHAAGAATTLKKVVEFLPDSSTVVPYKDYVTTVTSRGPVVDQEKADAFQARYKRLTSACKCCLKW